MKEKNVMQLEIITLPEPKNTKKFQIISIKIEN